MKPFNPLTDAEDYDLVGTEQDPIAQEDPNASMGPMPEQIDMSEQVVIPTQITSPVDNSTKLKQYQDLLAKIQPAASTAPQGPSQAEVLDNLLKSQQNSTFNNNLLRAGMMVNEAIAQSRGAKVPVNEEALKALDEQSRQPLEAFATKLKSSDLIESQDPNSSISQAARQMLMKAHPELNNEMFNKMSASQLQKLGFKLGYPNPQMINPMQMLQYELAVEKMKNWKQERAEKKEERQVKREDRAMERDQKNIQKLQKTIDPSQALYSSVENIEDMLGFNLDDYNAKKNTINNKQVDLPGVSIPGLGRVTAYSDTAKDLRTTFDNLFNVTLKQRSGSAVTDQELNRLKNEYALGKFDTEEGMLGALQRYKNILKKDFKNKTAAFDENILQTYEENQGALPFSRISEKPTAKFPIKVRNASTGQVATVSNEKELEEAQKEGFK